MITVGTTLLNGTIEAALNQHAAAAVNAAANEFAAYAPIQAGVITSRCC